MKQLILSPLYIALGCAVNSPAHAQSHDHSRHDHAAHQHHAPDKAGTKAQATEHHDHSAHAGHDHSKHNRGNHAEHAPSGNKAHDHSAHAGHDHSKHDHSGHADHHASRPVFPPITDADRAAAFPDLGDMTMADHGMDDEAIHFRTLFDGLEWRRARDGGSNAFAWNSTTWIGRDIDKLWLKTSGERRTGRTLNASVEALWGHAIGPWWDTVAGIRHDTRPGPSQTRAALGVQGLAPYQFEVDAMLYLGGHGKAELHLEAEYELLFTYQWILTPSLGTGFTARDDTRHGIESGWNGLEAALKLRYEIRPDIAPYIGYVWHGGGNVHAEEKGGQWVAGLRFWF